MRESRSRGSVRGALSNERPYRKTRASIKLRRRCVVAGSIMGYRHSDVQAISWWSWPVINKVGTVSSCLSRSDNQL